MRRANCARPPPSPPATTPATAPESSDEPKLPEYSEKDDLKYISGTAALLVVFCAVIIGEYTDLWESYPLRSVRVPHAHGYSEKRIPQVHGHHFRPVHNVPIQQWHMMRELAMTDGTLPTTPTVLKDSPATHWWRKNRGLWDLVHLSHLAYQTPAGEYNVTLLSQLVGPIEGVYDATTFLNHNTERYHSYSFVDGR